MTFGGQVKSVILKGWYGQRNFGDDLLLVVLADFLADAGLDTVVWSRWARYIQRLAPGVRPLQPWTNVRRPVALVYGGGTQFFTFVRSKRPSSHLPQSFRLLHNAGRLARGPVTASRLLLEKARRAKVARVASIKAAISVGVGPLVREGEDTREKLNVLRSLDWLSVRDQESRETCVAMEVPTPQVSADLAFLHGDVGKRCISPSAEVIVIPRFSRMDADWQRWEQAVLDILHGLGVKHYTVLYLCARDSGNANLLAARASSGLVWNPDILRLEDIISRLSAARLVISARYHGALVSAAAGVPTIVLGMDQKLRSLTRQLSTAILLESPQDVRRLVEQVRTTMQQRGFEEVAKSVVSLRKAARGACLDLLAVMGRGKDAS